MSEREKFVYCPTAVNYDGNGEAPAKEPARAPGSWVIRPEKREFAVDQSVTLAGVRMKNPVVVASGVLRPERAGGHLL